MGGCLSAAHVDGATSKSGALQRPAVVKPSNGTASLLSSSERPLVNTPPTKNSGSGWDDQSGFIADASSLSSPADTKLTSEAQQYQKNPKVSASGV